MNSTFISVSSSTKNGKEARSGGTFGDSGYLGAEKREDTTVRNNQGKPIRYKINRRPCQSKHASMRLRAQIKRREREKSSVRAKAAHVFAVVKISSDTEKHDTEACKNRSQN